MKFSQRCALIMSGGLLYIIIAGCMSDHSVARDYYAPSLYEDFKTISRLPSDQKTVKQEAKKVEEIKNKAEWTLPDCVNLAIINEDQLKIQGETYYQTKWFFLQALATWLPSVSLLNNRTSYNPTIAGTYFDKNEYWLNVHQPLFNAGRELVGVANAEQLSALRKYEFKQYRDILILAVADTFYQMLERQNELDALSALQEYTSHQFEMVKAREEAQVAQHKDTLLAEASLYDIQARMVRTRNLLNNARLNLQLLVGVPLPQKFIDSLALSELPEDNQSVLALALANRTDIKIAEQQIKLAEADVDLAKAGYLPGLNLDWNRYLHMESAPQSSLDWSLVLSLALPFDNGGKYGVLQEKYSKLRQANIAKERLLKNIQNDAAKAYTDLQAIQSDIEARAKGLAAAQETADIVAEQYKVGAATNIEVLFTKNVYETARIALDQSKTDLKLAYLRLKFVMGLLAKEF